MGMRNEFNYRWENPVKIRSCQYLNNVVEQDHRRIKFRLQPMLGFQRFYNARRVIAGIGRRRFTKNSLRFEQRLEATLSRCGVACWPTCSYVYDDSYEYSES